jgi:hypothetical protein
LITAKSASPNLQSGNITGCIILFRPPPLSPLRT